MGVPEQTSHHGSNKPTSAKSHKHFLRYEPKGGQNAVAAMGM